MRAEPPAPLALAPVSQGQGEAARRGSSPRSVLFTSSGYETLEETKAKAEGEAAPSRLEPPSLLFYFIGMRDSQGGTSSPPSHNVNCNPPWKMADHFSWNAPSSGQTAAQSLQPKRIALVVIEQVVPNPLTCSPACEYPRPNHGYAMPQEKGSGEDFLGQSRVRQTEAATRTVLALGVGTATSSPYLWIY